MACPACGSTQFTLLGYLGRLLWLRCRACGTDVQAPDEGGEG